MRLDVVISIICTNNRPALRQCLDTLPDACAGLAWEAVVIDNASTDGTGDMVRSSYPWAGLIVNPVRRGFSANHNQVLVPAVTEERARYSLILNDDVLLDPGSVSALVAAADADRRIGALGPLICGLDGARQQSIFPMPHVLGEIELPARGKEPKPTPERARLNGSCILFRCETLHQVGTLDERFFIFFEDTDISLRVWKEGWRVAICEDARIVHLEHQTVGRPALGSVMAKQTLRSRYLYFRKHHGRAKTWTVMTLSRLVLASRAAKAMVCSVVTGNPDERATARLLVDLIYYSPAQPLDHEIRARHAPPALVLPASETTDTRALTV